MTAQELIIKLQTVDPNTPIVIWDADKDKVTEVVYVSKLPNEKVIISYWKHAGTPL